MKSSNKKNIKKNSNLKNAFISLLRKIVKFFRKIIRKIKKTVKYAYASFMTLSATTRYIIGVWTGVIVLILLLVLVSQSNQNYLATYTQIESDINKAAISYVKDKEIYAVSNKKLKLQVDVLESMDYLYEDKITDNTCDGYALVYYDQDTDEYLSDSYITCKKYTTKGYGEE